MGYFQKMGIYNNSLYYNGIFCNWICVKYTKEKIV